MNIFEGQSLLERKAALTEDAFQHFHRAFDHVYVLLRQRTILFLPYLYRMTWQFRRPFWKGQEVVSKLLGFIVEMAKTYPDQHPVRQSIALLHQVSEKDRGEISGRVLQKILDRMYVEFHTDFADDMHFPSAASRLRICDLAPENHSRQNENKCHRSISNFDYTSVAVWSLIEEVNSVQRSSSLYTMHFM